MCFYISNKKSEKKVRTAGKNIVCYKVGFIKGSIRLKSKIFESCMRHFEYWFNIEYKIHKDNFKIKHSTVGRDYLSNNSIIEHGFHSFTNKNSAFREDDGRGQVVKCIIPAGSKYYVNSFYGEYVSNKIIIKEQIYI